MNAPAEPRRNAELDQRVRGRVVGNLAGSEDCQGQHREDHRPRCREDEQRDRNRAEAEQQQAAAPTRRTPRGHEQCPDQRTHPDRPGQEPEARRTDHEDVPGEHGHEREVRKDKQRRGGGEQDEDRQDRIVGNVPHAILQVPPECGAGSIAGPGHGDREPRNHEADNHEGNGICPEPEGEAPRGDGQAGDRRTDDPGEVVLRGIEGDRAADDRPVHDRRDDGLARRHLNRDHDPAEQCDERDVPVLDHPEGRQKRKGSREGGSGPVAPGQQAPPVQPVRHDSRHGREEEHGQAGNRADETQQGW